jgi:uncharacterized protein with FMN-binding domain
MIRGQTRVYYLLLALTITLSVLAVVTLLPSRGASKPNVLGYRSVCPYAPAATAICGLLAGVCCTVRNRLVSRQATSTRYQPPILPAVVGFALGTVAVVSGVSFAQAQVGFGAVIERSGAMGKTPAAPADGVRQATVTEGEVTATVEVAVVAGRIQTLTLREGRNVEDTVAEAMFGAVREGQSTAVDVVSGATATSQVLLRAIERAISGEP